MFLDDVLSETPTWHNVTFENVKNNLQMSYVPFSLSLKEAMKESIVYLCVQKNPIALESNCT